jgi:SAM-dependent methyltransferase
LKQLRLGMKISQTHLLAGVAGLLFWHGQIVSDAIEKTFTNIYETAEWGKDADNKGTSGPGSSLSTTTEYRAFLQQFLKVFYIKRVVDFGCGDWEFSQHIDWNGVDYIGYDVVKHVIEKNQQKFTKDNIHFIHGNVLTTNLPKADLLICKDVLQHLSIENIRLFLEQTPKFKYCLITNDVNFNTLTSSNPDISNGSYRHIDLTASPFSVKGFKILTYQAGFATKQVLLISSEATVNEDTQ